MSSSGNGKPGKKPFALEVTPKPPEQVTGGDKLVVEPGSVIRIPDPVVVRDLTVALAQKPFRIIADLMELGVFANVFSAVEFAIADRVARKYGYKAEKIG